LCIYWMLHSWDELDACGVSYVWVKLLVDEALRD
jgi:hypothetical protein